MQKPDMRSRLISARKKALNFRWNRRENYRSYIDTAVLVATDGFVKRVLSPADLLNIRLDFREAARLEAAIVARTTYFLGWINRIQEAHGISGLVRGNYNLGGLELSCWVESHELDLIPSDLELLKGDAEMVYEDWFYYCCRKGLDFWLAESSDDSGDWQRITEAEVQALVTEALPETDWAIASEVKGYVNASTPGKQRLYPSCDRQHPDDHQVWEVDLMLGRGVEMADVALWISARGCNSW